MTEIWNSAATTPAATHRVPVDRSSSSSPAHWTGQQIADVRAYIGETVNSLGSINTNQSLSLADGRYIAATITGNVQFTFTSVPTGATDLFLELTDAGAYTITFAASLTWTGGTAPTLPASGVALLHLRTRNGGTTYLASMVSDEQEFAASAITSGTLDAARLPAATTIASGAVELATVAECQAGTDTTRATTPEGVAAAIAALGLAQPLTTPRFTGQTSVPSAASAGEVKAYVRQLGKAFAAAYRGEVGDHIITMPPLTSTLVRGQWLATATTVATKGCTGNGNGTATATAHTSIPSIAALNRASAASANAQAYQGMSTNTVRDGSTIGAGFLTWGTTSLPDASYGSGATGAKINFGVHQGPINANNSRMSVRGASFEYNTNSSDTNWMAVVTNSGGTRTPVDTGLAFSAQVTYLWLIWCPRSGSSTYFYIQNLSSGSSGSATVAYVPEATLLTEYVTVTTFDTVARNIIFGDIWTLVGGAI